MGGSHPSTTPSPVRRFPVGHNHAALTVGLPRGLPLEEHLYLLRQSVDLGGLARDDVRQICHLALQMRKGRLTSHTAPMPTGSRGKGMVAMAERTFPIVIATRG